MQDIVATIRDKLAEIEREFKVRVIYACESGSRAWGFASPDSDYDVRFVYVRQSEDYLLLNPPRDTIEYELNEIYDISGWDVKKLLQLAYKSNPSVLEWAGSDITYRRTPDWDRVLPCVRAHFRPKHLLHHYLSMSKQNIGDHLKGNKIPLKKYLYMLRPLLAAQWIKERGSMAPMSFDTLCEAQLPEELRADVAHLLKLKKQAGEMEPIDRIAGIDSFILERRKFFEDYLSGLEDDARPSWDDLNACFAALVNV